MAENIYIKCSLCSEAHQYIFEDKQISALNAQWRLPDSEEGLLESSPVISQCYEVVLSGPLKIDISQPFWLVYMDPYSTLNGLEDEESIHSIRFCLCQHETVIEQQERSLRLKIKVLDTLGLQKHDAFINPKKIGWLVLLTKGDHRYRNESLFSNYDFININVQSDLGLAVVIKKEQDRSYIVAINEWDFHKDIWHLYYEELTPEKKQEYGITNL